MADLTTRSMAAIRQQYPQVYEALRDHETAINNIATQGNLSPNGATPPPAAHAALEVTGGAGYFRANITDNSPSFRGKEHFLEVSEDTSFTAPHVIHLGASTSWYGQLGAKDLHFRSYAQYPTSAPSPPVYQNNVSGAGAVAPSVRSTQRGLQGYGAEPYTTPTVPKR